MNSKKCFRPENIDVGSTFSVKDEVRKGKIFKRLEIPVSEEVYGGMTKAELSEAEKIELQLAQQDLKMERIKDKKNALESYVYEMRDKVYSFMSSSLFPDLTFCHQLLNWHAESMPSWLSNVFVECTMKLVDVLILFFHSLYRM